jgi:hypothetical protein
MRWPDAVVSIFAYLLCAFFCWMLLGHPGLT